MNSKTELTQGVVYVATQQERFLAEAAESAFSLKHLCPQLPITLFTDLPSSRFTTLSCFDTLSLIQSSKNSSSPWANGQLDRIRCLRKSPYAHTLHLDTDTIIRSEILTTIFSFLDTAEIALGECRDDNSVSMKVYGRPMFNCGVILYKNTEKVNALLEAWERLVTHHLSMLSQSPVPTPPYLAHLKSPELLQKMLCIDQIAMVQYLSPEVNVYDLEIHTLQPKWNFRGGEGNLINEQEIVIDHRDIFKKKTLPLAPHPRATITTSPITTVSNTQELQQELIARYKEGDIDAAIKLLEKTEESVFSLTNLCKLYREKGALRSAIHFGKKAIEQPDVGRQSYINLAIAQMVSRKAQDGLTTLRKAMESYPIHAGTTALYTIALHETAHDAYEQYVQLYEDVKLIRIEEHIRPKDLHEFNKALSAHILQDPNLSFAPDKHSTVNGFHSGNLVGANNPQLSTIQKLITDEKNIFAAQLKEKHSIPFFNHDFEDLAMTMWSVVLGNQGFQEPHVHRSGWISGVYYCKVPQCIASDDKEHSGWLELGLAPESYGAYSSTPVRLIQPEEGVLVLFPSYYWHRTVPFTGNENRISIAFDFLSAPPNP